MKLLLIDESKEKKFILCVAEMDRETAPAARKALNKSRMKSQADIHFISERPSRKKQILKNMSQIKFKITNFRVEGVPENEARTKCFDALIESLNPKLSYALIIEQDDYKVQTDKKTIRNALIKKGMNFKLNIATRNLVQNACFGSQTALPGALQKGEFGKKNWKSSQLKIWM
jgi:hypothetical protein